MNYQQKLKNATTIKEVQETYEKAFLQMMLELEEEFVSEGQGQRLVYDDGSIDISLPIADITLLIQADLRANELLGNKEEEMLITSSFDSFTQNILEELQN